MTWSSKSSARASARRTKASRKLRRKRSAAKNRGPAPRMSSNRASTTSAMKIRTTPNLPFRHRISSKATARSPSKSSRRKNAMLIWPRTTTSTKRKPSSVKKPTGPRRMMNWSKPIRAAMTIRIQPRKMTREATRNPIKARIRNRLNRSAPSTWICSTSRS